MERSKEGKSVGWPRKKGGRERERGQGAETEMGMEELEEAERERGTSVGASVGVAVKRSVSLNEPSSRSDGSVTVNCQPDFASSRSNTRASAGVS